MHLGKGLCDQDNFPDEAQRAKIGSRSPITRFYPFSIITFELDLRFVRTLLHLLETGTARPHLKHLTELFSFLLDFAKENSNNMLGRFSSFIFPDFTSERIYVPYFGTIAKLLTDFSRRGVYIYCAECLVEEGDTRKKHL